MPGPQRICLSGPLTRAAANSHTASRGNQLREASIAVIADMRHIRNGTALISRSEVTGGAASAASGNLAVKPQADSMIDPSDLAEFHGAPRAKRTTESGRRF